MKKETTVYLGLGTNHGNKEENLMRAIEELSLALDSCIAVSTFIETAPWGFESENSFLNCAAIFTTDKSPIELLDTTEEIERRLGRTTKSTNGLFCPRGMTISRHSGPGSRQEVGDAGTWRREDE